METDFFFNNLYLFICLFIDLYFFVGSAKVAKIHFCIIVIIMRVFPENVFFN